MFSLRLIVSWTSFSRGMRDKGGLGLAQMDDLRDRLRVLKAKAAKLKEFL